MTATTGSDNSRYGGSFSGCNLKRCYRWALFMILFAGSFDVLVYSAQPRAAEVDQKSLPKRYAMVATSCIAEGGQSSGNKSERYDDLAIRYVDRGEGEFAEIDQHGRVVGLAFDYELPLNPSKRRSIKSAPELKMLSFEYAQITNDDLRLLMHAPKLEQLYLGKKENSEHHAVNDEGLKHLTRLKSLYLLQIASKKVTDRGLVYLSGLKKLETLDLDYTSITDRGVDYLVRHKQLKRLSVRGTLISAAGADRLCTLLPSTKVIIGP